LLTLHHLTNDFKSRSIRFRNEELNDLMWWTRDSGYNNRRLEIGLDRLAGTRLRFQNTWKSAGDRLEKTFSTGLIDNYLKL